VSILASNRSWQRLAHGDGWGCCERFLILVLPLVLIKCAGLAAVATSTTVEPSRQAQAHLPVSQPPPLPQLPRNPVDTFRQLLAMSAPERQKVLDAKPAKSRQVLVRRLAEFDAMSPGERELRLRLLELRYYLVPLLRADPTNRLTQISYVPTEHRPLIEGRLHDWDMLPAGVRDALIQNENALRYFPSFETNNPAQRAAVLNELSPDRRRQLEDDLRRWDAYPPEQRVAMYEQFQHYFELSDRQRDRTLSTLGDPERRRMESALKEFEKLPADHRAKCMEAFQRFCAMSTQERNEFLASAARWESLSSDERRAWRQFVAQLPPSPPELGISNLNPPLPPPIPTNRPITNAQVGRP